MADTFQVFYCTVDPWGKSGELSVYPGPWFDLGCRCMDTGCVVDQHSSHPKACGAHVISFNQAFLSLSCSFSPASYKGGVSGERRLERDAIMDSFFRELPKVPHPVVN